MELLVKRDGTFLEKVEGQSFVDSSAPFYLQTPRVVPVDLVDFLEQRPISDDLLLVDSTDSEIMRGHSKSMPSEQSDSARIPAFWSGYRSVIVQDPKTSLLFRLKGVALNVSRPHSQLMPDGHYRILGGQKYENAQWEREMSDKFAGILENEGIEPAMKVLGMWKYPNKARGSRAVASVVQIPGDTRLDELMFVLEGLASGKYALGRKKQEGNTAVVEIGTLSYNGEKFFGALSRLYHDIGFAVGRLKRLMDRNKQTWSSDCEQSNAHIGNVVVYNGTDKLKVGLVDFDISCDQRNFTRSEMRAIQRNERATIVNSALHGPISPRQITGKPFLKEVLTHGEHRKEFAKGFEAGYAWQLDSYSNQVELGSLHEIFALLRQIGAFSTSPRTQEQSDSLIYKGDRHGLGNYIDLSEIIGKHYGYQKIIKEKENNGYFSLLDDYGLYGISGKKEKRKKDYFSYI